MIEGKAQVSIPFTAHGDASPKQSLIAFNTPLKIALMITLTMVHLSSTYLIDIMRKNSVQVTPGI